MHSAIFKTFVKTGDIQPQELLIEYLPDADMVIFTLAGKELFSLNYSENLQVILSAINTISDESPISFYADDDAHDDFED